jgi:hypothetical protein
MSDDSRQCKPYTNRKLMTTMNKSGIIAPQNAQRPQIPQIPQIAARTKSREVL